MAKRTKHDAAQAFEEALRPAALATVTAMRGELFVSEFIKPCCRCQRITNLRRAELGRHVSLLMVAYCGCGDEEVA